MISLSQDEVMQNWTDSYTKPLVSIDCIAYNHEDYVSAALDGFLIQKTNFPFEILIHDDASTDKTAAIIKDYEKKYPLIVKPIYQSENQWSKGGGSISAKFNYPRVTGKYIALCEGDDYWIDENKLQKQVDFLESHPDYSACFHRAQVLSEGELSDSVYRHLREGEYDANAILKHWTVPTASFVFRAEFKDKIPIDADFMYGDIVLFETVAHYGKLYCLSDTMSVYRRVESGITGTQHKNRTFELYKRTDRHYKALRRHFPRISCVLIAKLRMINFLFSLAFMIRKYVLRSV